MKELESWREEQRSAYLYRLLAQIEAGAPRARLFTELAKEAEEQSGIWAQAAMRKGAAQPGAFRPDVRTRLVAAMTRRLGPRAMRSILAAMKVRGMSVYSGAHPGHPMPQAGGGPERRHRGLASGGNLRAGVFGVNDGLVSNASLILGVAGAHADPNVILLSGVAGLLAGAFSMAAGEYVSVRSQRELIDAARPDPASQSVLPDLDVDANELALVYRARGMTQAAAEARATEVLDSLHLTPDFTPGDPEETTDTVGTAWGAAISSFCFFASGALIPVLPYLFGATGVTAIVIASVLVGLALLATGAVVGLLSGASPLKRALRQLAIGFGAAAVTYLLGLWFGATL